MMAAGGREFCTLCVPKNLARASDLVYLSAQRMSYEIGQRGEPHTKIV